MQQRSKWVEATFLPYEYFAITTGGFRGPYSITSASIQEKFVVKRIDRKRKKIWVKFL